MGRGCRGVRAPSQLVFIPYVNGVNAGLREAYSSCYDKYAAVRTAIWPSCVLCRVGYWCDATGDVRCSSLPRTLFLPAHRNNPMCACAHGSTVLAIFSAYRVCFSFFFSCVCDIAGHLSLLLCSMILGYLRSHYALFFSLTLSNAVSVYLKNS